MRSTYENQYYAFCKVILVIYQIGMIRVFLANEKKDSSRSEFSIVVLTIRPEVPEPSLTLIALLPHHTGLAPALAGLEVALGGDGGLGALAGLAAGLAEGEAPVVGLAAVALLALDAREAVAAAGGVLALLGALAVAVAFWNGGQRRALVIGWRHGRSKNKFVDRFMTPWAARHSRIIECGSRLDHSATNNSQIS